MPRPGDFRHRIAVLNYTTTVDTVGARKRDWAVASRIWGAVEFEYRPTDQFAETANMQSKETRVWFTTRYTEAITIQHRLRHRNKDYEILSLQDIDGRNRELRILAREVATGST